MLDESLDELRTLEPNNILEQETEETEAAAAAIQPEAQGNLILDPLSDAEIHQMEENIMEMKRRLNRGQLFNFR